MIQKEQAKSVELLPCPFCGATQDTDRDVCETGVFWVRCSECCAESEVADTREEAASKWNRRATPPAALRDLSS